MPGPEPTEAETNERARKFAAAIAQRTNPNCLNMLPPTGARSAVADVNKG